MNETTTGDHTMTPEPTQYGVSLREWRTANDLRVEVVAVGCEISTSTIRNVEQGRTQEPTRLVRKAVREFARKRKISPPAGW